MIEVFRLRWERGHMHLNVNSFFPCSIQQFKQVLKVVEMDYDPEARRNELIEYFRAKLDECEENRRLSAKRYGDNKQFEADSKRKVENGKFPNGIIMSTIAMKEAKEELKFFRREANGALSCFKVYERDIKSYKKYLEILE